METNKCAYPEAVVHAMQSIKNHIKPFFCEQSDRVGGWTYKSEFTLTLCDSPVTFRIFTCKRDGYIRSTLTGHRLNTCGSMVHVMGLGHRGDFSQVIHRESNKRATRKLLLSKHVDAIVVSSELGDALDEYYRHFFAQMAKNEVMEHV